MLRLQRNSSRHDIVVGKNRAGLKAVPDVLPELIDRTSAGKTSAHPYDGNRAIDRVISRFGPHGLCLLSTRESRRFDASTCRLFLLRLSPLVTSSGRPLPCSSKDT